MTVGSGGTGRPDRDAWRAEADQKDDAPEARLEGMATMLTALTAAQGCAAARRAPRRPTSQPGCPGCLPGVGWTGDVRSPAAQRTRQPSPATPRSPGGEDGDPDRDEHQWQQHRAVPEDERGAPRMLDQGMAEEAPQPGHDEGDGHEVGGVAP